MHRMRVAGREGVAVQVLGPSWHGVVRSRRAGRVERRARTGRPGFAGDGIERDRLSRVVHPTKCRDGAAPCGGSSASGRCDDVVGVVSSHAGVRALRRGLLDLADHPVEVGQNLLVHLGHAGLSAAFGHVDQGEGAPRCSRSSGRNSGPVRKTGQVRQALACGQVRCSGSPQ